MAHREYRSISRPLVIIALRTTIGVGAILLLSGTFAVLAPRSASAKPEFAAQTGLPCGQCHVNPAGSGALKPFGQKFKANGFKIKKK
jgi:hypothetical protein